MSPQKLSAAGSVGSASPHTFVASKSKMEIEPALAKQTSAKTGRRASTANFAYSKGRRAQGARGNSKKSRS